MDRTTRALYASADNAAAIEALMRTSADNATAIEALREELKGGSDIKIRMVEGTRSGLTTTFGVITAKTRAGIIVAYTGASSVLYLNEVEIMTGSSPMFVVLSKGTGELTLRGNCSNSRAFIIEM